MVSITFAGFLWGRAFEFLLGLQISYSDFSSLSLSLSSYPLIPLVLFVGNFLPWFHGIISRKEAERLLAPRCVSINANKNVSLD